MENSDDMTNPAVPAVPLEQNRCPRCAASDAVLSLLTSMTRYHACRRCDYRWQVSASGAPPEGDLT